MILLYVQSQNTENRQLGFHGNSMIIQSNISMRTSDMANHHTSSRRRPFLTLVEIMTTAWYIRNLMMI